MRAIKLALYDIGSRHARCKSVCEPLTDESGAREDVVIQCWSVAKRFKATRKVLMYMLDYFYSLVLMVTKHQRCQLIGGTPHMPKWNDMKEQC